MAFRPYLCISLCFATLVFMSSAFSSETLTLPVETVSSIGLGVWIENIAVRSCGCILAVGLTPNIFQINPHGDSAAQIIHSFPAPVTAITGLTETFPDIWYFSTGNVTNNTQTPTPGSMSVWEADFTDVSCSSRHGRRNPSVRKVADVQDAGILDGTTTLSSERGLLLVSDAKLGLVWRVDINTGEATQILNTPDMKAIPGRIPPIGVNGVHVRNGDLYFTNTDHSTVWRLPLQPDGSAAGTAEVVGYGLGGTLDDFAMDDVDNIYVAMNATGLVFVPVDDSKPSTLLAGGDQSTALLGITGAAFGRTTFDRGVLYMGTTGGSFNYFSGNFTRPGGVSKIDLRTSGYWNSGSTGAF